MICVRKSRFTSELDVMRIILSRLLGPWERWEVTGVCEAAHWPLATTLCTCRGGHLLKDAGVYLTKVLVVVVVRVLCVC